MPRPKGYKHTEETKRKIRKARQGYRHSEETKRKMRKPRPATRTGRWAKCKVCGKEIWRTLSNEKYNKKNCCSQRCDNIDRWKRGVYKNLQKKKTVYTVYTLKKCLFCGKEVIYPLWKNKRKYCSKKCADLVQKGKPKRNRQGIKHWNWQNGKTPFNLRIRKIQEYYNWRDAVYERDNYTCQYCGDSSGHNLVAHHKKKFYLLLDEFLQEYNQFSLMEDKETLIRLAVTYKPFWDINNGQTLCEKCHIKITCNGSWINQFSGR